MSTQHTHGIVHHADTDRKTDYLYRVSLKCLVFNDRGEVLVVKESGRDWWDLPGGGMDHGEDLKTAIAREMKEEVNLAGDFAYQIIAVDEPKRLEKHSFWQLRLIFAVTPQNLHVSAGEDGDEIAFRKPTDFQHSPLTTEQKIYQYSAVANQKSGH